MEYDPKCAWALKHLDLFPVEINRASVETLLRVPGIGAKGAYKITSARKFTTLTFEHLQKMRIVLKRARHFITCNGKFYGVEGENKIKTCLTLVERTENAKQISLFEDGSPFKTALLTTAQTPLTPLTSANDADKKFLLGSTPEIAKSVLLGEL